MKRQTQLTCLSCLTSLSLLGYAAAARAASPGDAETPPAETSAPDAQPETRSAERHHQGFYLRSHLGGGYRTASATVSGDDMRIKGAGVSFGFAVGGAVVKDVVVYGEMLVDAAKSPTIATSARSATADGVTLSVIALGPGVAYYIMPANVHVGVSALLTKLSLDSDRTSYGQTGWGFGGVARVGKDFWIGRNVGMGVMGQVTLATMKDSESVEGKTPNWKSTTATLALEFTYH